jgi:hypothetical protein
MVPVPPPASDAVPGCRCEPARERTALQVFTMNSGGPRSRFFLCGLDVGAGSELQVGFSEHLISGGR